MADVDLLCALDVLVAALVALLVGPALLGVALFSVSLSLGHFCAVYGSLWRDW